MDCRGDDAKYGSVIEVRRRIDAPSTLARMVTALRSPISRHRRKPLQRKRQCHSGQNYLIDGLAMLAAMPRPRRPIEDGLVYHVSNRGNNRQHVFCMKSDLDAFRQAMVDCKDRKQFELYGDCLISNHFHLLRLHFVLGFAVVNDFSNVLQSSACGPRRCFFLLLCCFLFSRRRRIDPFDGFVGLRATGR
jgi:hypothetical protein